MQVLVPPQEGLMGCTAEVLITASGRWSVRGQLLRVLTHSRPGAPPLPQGVQPAADLSGGSSTRSNTSSADTAGVVRGVVTGSSTSCHTAVSPTAAAAAPPDKGDAGAGGPHTPSTCSAAACSEAGQSQQVRDAQQPQQPANMNDLPASLEVSHPAGTHTMKTAASITRAAPDAAAKSAAQPSLSMAEWGLPDHLLALGVILGLVGLLLSGLLTLASSLQAG